MADFLKSRRVIEFGCFIAVAHFQVQPPCAALGRRRLHLAEQVPADSPTAKTRPHRNQQQFGLIDDHSRHGKAGRLVILADQRDPAMHIAQHSIALRARPSFPETRVKGIFHDGHYIIEFAVRSAGWCRAKGCDHTHWDGFASGARP